MPAIEYALLLIATAMGATYVPSEDYYGAYMADLMDTDVDDWDDYTQEPMPPIHNRPYWARTH